MQLRKSLDHSHSSNGSPSMALRNRLINFFNLPPRHPGQNMDFHLPRARSALNNSCNLTNLGVANYISKSSKGGSFVTAQNVWLHFVRMNDFIYLDNKGNPFPARVHGHVYNPLGLSAPSLSLSSFLPSLHQRSFQPPPSLLMVDDLVRQCANFVMAYRLTGCLKVIDYIQTFVSPKIVICLTLVINFEYYTINLYVIKYLLTPCYMLGLVHHHNHEICKC